MAHARFTTRLAALAVPVATALLMSGLTPAVAVTAAPVPVRHLTSADLAKLARSNAHPATRAADAAAVARSRDSERGLPTFSSSYSAGGVTYPYTMLGAAPASGRTTKLKTVVVPLRMVFKGFAQDAVFDPSFAVHNMLRSPIYNDATYLNGRGQFGDQLQRATFWNQMDRQHQWHTLMADPDVRDTVTITVTPATGELFDSNGLLGNMNIDAFDAQLHAILPKLHLDADQTPLFVTQAVIADALGYHDAFMVPDGHGGQRVQTLMWSSWLDPNQVGTLLGDVSTLNHEVGEWLNDPYIDNGAPQWAFPPFNTVCGENPFVEVGDPQGNGPDYALFPTVAVRLNGYTYHLQDLALLPWFTRQSPSPAYKGWYAFPDPTQLTSPSVDCP
jgi:hypothetical protein